MERRARSTQAVEFFNVLTSPELLETTEALLPEHRERLYPPTVTLSMYMRQVLEADGSCQKELPVEHGLERHTFVLGAVLVVVFLEGCPEHAEVVWRAHGQARKNDIWIRRRACRGAHRMSAGSWQATGISHRNRRGRYRGAALSYHAGLTDTMTTLSDFV